MPDKGAARRVQKSLDRMRDAIKKDEQKLRKATPGSREYKQLQENIQVNNRGIAHTLRTCGDLDVR